MTESTELVAETKKKRPGKAKGTRYAWPPKKRIEVVTTYLTVGNSEITSALTKVPAETIRVWKLKPWWQELVDQIRSDERLQLDAKLSKIVTKSIDVINDRIENGDFIFDSKTGDFKRAPVKARDALKISTDLIDKRMLLQKEDKSKVKEDQSADRLLKLAEQFAEFVTKQRNPSTIDAQTLEIIP